MNSIDPRAIIDPSAKLADGVEVGPWSIVGPDVEIGEGTIIGPHVVLKGPRSAKTLLTSSTRVSRPVW